MNGHTRVSIHYSKSGIISELKINYFDKIYISINLVEMFVAETANSYHKNCANFNENEYIALLPIAPSLIPFDLMFVVYQLWITFKLKLRMCQPDLHTAQNEYIYIWIYFPGETASARLVFARTHTLTQLKRSTSTTTKQIEKFEHLK